MREPRFIVRGLEFEEDLSRLIRLVQEVEATDQTGEDVSAEAIQSFLNVPGHDPLKDRWIVENPDDPDGLIAHSLLLKRQAGNDAEAAGAVHPAWRGRGIGSELLRRTISRARELEASQVTASS
jgi:mycothiol synthase